MWLRRTVPDVAGSAIGGGGGATTGRRTFQIRLRAVDGGSVRAAAGGPAGRRGGVVQARGQPEAARGAKSHEPRRDSSPEWQIQASGGRLQRGVEAAAGRRDHHHEPAQTGGDSRVTSAGHAAAASTRTCGNERVYDTTPRKDPPPPTRRISRSPHVTPIFLPIFVCNPLTGTPTSPGRRTRGH